MELYDPFAAIRTQYVFFTGKGGVGKTSTACATAVALADAGQKVLLVSTDPASNLQDIFSLELKEKPTPIPGVPGLEAANLDPVKAAAAYRESVVGPYRGILPEAALRNMEEQLSGSCTIEIAAFNAFTDFLTDPETATAYDKIIFDTAPTGHTLRMLQLPSAWSQFISTSTHGASCLGQLSGLESRKALYRQAVETLADPGRTTLLLVARPDRPPLLEADRASRELAKLGIGNQQLIINGLLEKTDDPVTKELFAKQQMALAEMSQGLKILPSWQIPFRSYNVTGLDHVRALLKGEVAPAAEREQQAPVHTLQEVAEDLERNHRKVIFTMGKGGVGKTTVAASLALRLAQKGHQLLLTTTDPAGHLQEILDQTDRLQLCQIDEQAELRRYQQEVLDQARKNGLKEGDLAYIKEDLRSPCTQEIAVFRAFAEIVARSGDRIVIIDTAPTGHTLLLLESTENYDREIRRTRGAVPPAVQQLLPRLKGPETEVVIVTLPEATPVYEALRLEADLKRTRLYSRWWIINRCFSQTAAQSPLLKAKADREIPWINQVAAHADGCAAVIPWKQWEIKGKVLETL